MGLIMKKNVIYIPIFIFDSIIILFYWMKLCQLDIILPEDILFLILQVIIGISGIVTLNLLVFRKNRFTILKRICISGVYISIVLLTGTLVYFIYNDSAHAEIKQNQVLAVKMNEQHISDKTRVTDIVKAYNRISYVKRNPEGAMEGTPDYTMYIELTEGYITINTFGEWLVIHRVNADKDWYYWGKNKDINCIFAEYEV